MRIGIKTMMWKRPEVFEMYAAGVNRLRETFGVIPFVVGSEGALSRNRCERHGFNYIEHANKPLGAKANACLQVMRTHNLDYVLNLGADDLISNSLMRLYIELMNEGYDFIGIKDLYFYERIQKKLIYFPGYTGQRKGESVGVGRVLSARLLDRFNWQMWDEKKNRSLDLSMTKKLHAINNKWIISLKDTGTFAVDIKDSDNIWKFSVFEKMAVDIVDVSLMEKVLTNK